jgi:hypothetical protein
MLIATVKSTRPAAFWSARREASLNWLALGLLLAAWNASDQGAPNARRRPEALRGYSSVSPRAAQGVRQALQGGHKTVNVL